MSWIAKVIASLVIIFIVNSSSIFAHCEIPCGIYNDELRINLIAEHIGTVEKSMNKIIEIEKAKTANNNQLVRWINNKEFHANEIQAIVWQYFMTQRIKPDTKKYAEKLSILHQLLIYSMKSKQSVDLKHITKLKELLQKFKKLYLN